MTPRCSPSFPSMALAVLAFLSCLAPISTTTTTTTTIRRVRFGYINIAKPTKLLYYQRLLDATVGGTRYVVDPFPVGSGAVITRLLANGEIDFGELGGTPFVAAVNRGARISQIYTLNAIGRSEGLVVSSAIVAPRDLLGKLVATPSLSTAHMHTVYMFEVFGLPWQLCEETAASACSTDPDAVTLILLQPDAMVAAWNANEIAAGYVWNPAKSAMLAAPGATYMIDSAILGRWGQELFEFLAVNDGFAAVHPQYVERVAGLFAAADESYLQSPSSWAAGSPYLRDVGMLVEGLSPQSPTWQADQTAMLASIQEMTFYTGAAQLSCAMLAAVADPAKCLPAYGGSAAFGQAAGAFLFSLKQILASRDASSMRATVGGAYLKASAGTTPALFDAIAAGSGPEPVSATPPAAAVPCSPSTVTLSAATSTPVMFSDGHAVGGPYLPSQTCTWRIPPSAAAAASIELTFSLFSSERTFDTLTVYEGSDANTGRLLAFLTGRLTWLGAPIPKIVSHGPLFVQWQALTGTRSTRFPNPSEDGFRASFRQIENGFCSSDADCGGPAQGTCVTATKSCACEPGYSGGDCAVAGCSGTMRINVARAAATAAATAATTMVMTHGPAGTLAQNDAWCRWEVTASAGQVPTLTFDQFNVDDGFDFVHVYDAQGNRAESFTGAVNPGTRFKASSQTITVEFRSDSIVRSAGFSVVAGSADASIDCNDSSGCSLHGICQNATCVCEAGYYGRLCGSATCAAESGTLRRKAGTIKSQAASTYVHSQTCAWVIRPEDIGTKGATGVQFYFLRLDLEETKQFATDRIEVFDASSGFVLDTITQRAGIARGSQTLDIDSVTWFVYPGVTQLGLRLKTDLNVNQGGFDLAFEGIYPCSSQCLTGRCVLGECDVALPTPTLTSITPDTVFADGSSMITLTGSRFTAGKIVVVYIGATARCEDLAVLSATTATCRPPRGVDERVPITIAVDGRTSFVAEQTPRITYRAPVVLGTNITWGIEGLTALVTGFGFVPGVVTECKTGRFQQSRIGTYISPSQVTCPLGGNTDNDPVKMEIYVTQDGRRWTGVAAFSTRAVQWRDGGTVTPRTTANAPSEIVIGMLTGRNSSNCARHAWNALAQVNANPAVLPMTRLKMRGGFSGGNGTRAALEARRLLRDEQVVAFFGPTYSSTAIVVSSQVATWQRVPLLSPSASSNALTSRAAHPYFARIYPVNENLQQAAVAVLAAKGWQYIAIIASSDEYGKDYASGLRRMFEAQQPANRVLFERLFDQPSRNVDAQTLASVQKQVLEAFEEPPWPLIVVIESRFGSICRDIIKSLATAARAVGGGHGAGGSSSSSSSSSASSSSSSSSTSSSSSSSSFSLPPQEASLMGYAILLGPTCMGELKKSSVTAAGAADESGVLFGRGALAVTVASYNDFCSDAIHVLSHAIDRAIVAEIPLGSTDTQQRGEARAQLMDVLRSAVVPAELTATGEVSFVDASNNRHARSMTFYVDSLEHASGAASMSVRRVGYVQEGAASFASDVQVMWPGGTAATPNDVGVDFRPQKVAVLHFDYRGASILDYARRAAIEINSPRTSLLQGTLLEVTLVNSNELADTAAYLRYVDVFMERKRNESVPVAAIVADGSGISSEIHDRLQEQGHEVMVMTPVGAADKLADARVYPHFLRTTASNANVVAGLFSVLRHFDFKRSVLIRNHPDSSHGTYKWWVDEVTQRIVDEAAVAGIDNLVVYCDEGAIDLDAVRAHSKIVIPVLVDSSFQRCMETLRNVTTTVEFDVVLPFIEWYQAEYFPPSSADLMRTWAPLLDGALGVSGSGSLYSHTPRYEQYEAFWAEQEDSWAYESPTLAGMKAYDTEFMIAAALDRCLSTGDWLHDIGIEGLPPNFTGTIYGRKFARALELKRCFRARVTLGLQGPLVAANHSNNMDFQLGVNNVMHNQPGGGSRRRRRRRRRHLAPTTTATSATALLDLVPVGLVSARGAVVELCPDESSIGGARLGVGCTERVLPPSAVVAEARSASAIVVRWSHNAPHQQGLLLGFRIDLTQGARKAKVELGPESMSWTGKVEVGMESAASLATGALALGTLVQGTPIFVGVRARYVQDVMSAAGQAAICIALDDQRHTCGCSTSGSVGPQYHSQTQPQLRPSKWSCEACPDGAKCDGKTWRSIESKAGYFMALPECAQDGYMLERGARCNAKPLMLPCANEEGFEKYSCPGNFSAHTALDILNGLGPTNATQCGEGYTGFTCAACRAGFAQDETTKRCMRCTSEVEALFPTIFGSLTVLFVAGAAILGALHYVRTHPTGTDNKLKELLKVLNTRGGPKKLEGVFQAIDLDGNGRLEREEFRSFMATLSDVRRLVSNTTTEDVSDAINRFTKRKTMSRRATLSRQLSAFQIANLRIADKEADDLFTLIDKDGSGEIKFEEFYLFLVEEKSTSKSRHRARQIMDHVRTDAFRTSLRILLKYIQVITAIPANFPEVMPQFYARLSWMELGIRRVSYVVDLDLLSLSSFECLTSTRFYPKLVRNTLTPFTAIVLLGLLASLFNWRSERPGTGYRRQGQWVLLAFVAEWLQDKILFFMYPGVSRTILQGLHCSGVRPEVSQGDDVSAQALATNTASSTSSSSASGGSGGGGSSSSGPGGGDAMYGAWLDADPTISCTGNYLGMSFGADDPNGNIYRTQILPFAVSMLFLFSLGIPAAIFVRLSSWRYPVNLLWEINGDGDPRQSSAAHRIHKLFRGYSPKYWWFQPVDLLRHYFLTAFVGAVFVGGVGGTAGFGDKDVRKRLLIAAVVCLCCVMYFNAYNVYSTARCGAAQGLAHFSLVWIFGYLMALNGRSRRSTVLGISDVAAGIIVFLPIVFCLAVMAGMKRVSCSCGVKKKSSHPQLLRRRQLFWRRRIRLSEAFYALERDLQRTLQAKQDAGLRHGKLCCASGANRKAKSGVQSEKWLRLVKTFEGHLRRLDTTAASVGDFHSRNARTPPQPPMTWKNLADLERDCYELYQSTANRRGPKVVDGASGAKGELDVTLLTPLFARTLMAPSPSVQISYLCIVHAHLLFATGNGFSKRIQRAYMKEMLAEERRDSKAVLEWVHDEDVEMKRKIEEDRARLKLHRSEEERKEERQQVARGAILTTPNPLASRKAAEEVAGPDPQQSPGGQIAWVSPYIRTKYDTKEVAV